MSQQFRKWLLIGVSKVIFCISVNAQTKIADRFYLEASVGTSILNSWGSDYLYSPCFLLSLGHKINTHKNVYFDLSLQYSDLRTQNKIVFVEPFGTVLNKNNLKNLQIYGMIGFRINKFSLESGIGSYYTFKSKSEEIREHDSFVISSDNSFSAFNREDNYQNFGFSIPFEIGYVISENVELKLNSDFLFIEGITPINSKGLRYLYITNIGISFRRYL